jgi:cation:H+ antiporter
MIITDILILIASLVLILLAAEFFTNGVEHLGERLKLGEAAVGSVLAAVGTAMPETMIPIVAILAGHGTASKAGHEIGIGAILGAPFMLATLAFAITAISAIAFARRRQSGSRLSVDRSVISRDLLYFLPMYGAAIASSWLPTPFRWIICIGLLVGYAHYVWVNLHAGGGLPGRKKPLRLQVIWLHLSLTRLPEETRKAFVERIHLKAGEPGLAETVGQVILSLGIMLLGAKFFVAGVEDAAGVLGINSLIVALVLAPIATELPEKFNSILWVRDDKDTLAMGNITGAMVFQSSIPVTLGIAMTSWQLHTPGQNHAALISAAVALVSAFIVLTCVRHRHQINTKIDKTTLSPWVLLVGLPLYGIFFLSLIMKW